MKTKNLQIYYDNTVTTPSGCGVKYMYIDSKTALNLTGRAQQQP